ncbi:MAG: hypothetical protein ACOVQE_07980 [Chitinophagaceae bacterium]
MNLADLLIIEDDAITASIYHKVLAKLLPDNRQTIIINKTTIAFQHIKEAEKPLVIISEIFFRDDSFEQFLQAYSKLNRNKQDILCIVTASIFCPPFIENYRSVFKEIYFFQKPVTLPMMQEIIKYNIKQNNNIIATC